MTFFPFGALVPSVKFSLRSRTVCTLGQLCLSCPHQLSMTHTQHGQVGLPLVQDPALRWILLNLSECSKEQFSQ